MMLRGDSLHFTTAAGWIMTAVGAGRQDPTGSGRTMLLRWWPGLEVHTLASASALAVASASVSAADLAGAR